MWLFYKIIRYKIQKKKNERETKEKPWRHIKTPIMTPLVLLKRYQRDESNDTKNVIDGDQRGSREQSKDKWVSTPLDCLCEPLHSLFMIFFLSLDLSCQDLSKCMDDVVIRLRCEFSVIFFFYFFLSSLSSL